MEREEIRIVCFGSGDFPVETFEFLAKYYNVVGFVTSKDKPVFGSKRVFDIANEYNIPVYIPDNLENEEFLNWLDKINGNVYCVISYKYLPKCVVKKAKYSFNIHASLLPLLRGAAPINWAIRYGLKRTGLSVIKLADKIDTGGIIGTYGLDIEDNDNYETLFKKLAEACVLLTSSIFDEIEDDMFEVHVEQPQIPKELNKGIFCAPKLTLENTTCRYYDFMADAKKLNDAIRSLSPNIGMTFNMFIQKWIKDEKDEDGGYLEDVKKITFKVYESELVNKDNSWIDEHYNGSDIITDWRTYLYMSLNDFKGDMVSIKKIQVSGKKILDVKDFLKGFQVYNNPENIFFLN